MQSCGQTAAGPALKEVTRGLQKGNELKKEGQKSKTKQKICKRMFMDRQASARPRCLIAHAEPEEERQPRSQDTAKRSTSTHTAGQTEVTASRQPRSPASPPGPHPSSPGTPQWSFATKEAAGIGAIPILTRLAAEGCGF